MIRTETVKRNERRLLGRIPGVARRRLLRIGIGWAVAALAESTAYTVLALTIRNGGGITPVVATATAAVLVTVLVSRAGYLAGARVAGDLYNEMGQALARAKLSWFTDDHRALVSAATGHSVPAFMGLPAHQLQTLVLAPLVPLLMVAGIAIVSGFRAAALVLVLLTFALATQTLAQRHLARADARRHALERRVSESTLELVDRLELLRTAAGPSRALDRSELVWSAHEAAMAHTNRVAAPATFVSAIASVLPLAGVLILLPGAVGFSDPAAALALVVLTARASAPLDDLALIGISMNELRTHTDFYREVASAPSLPTTVGTPTVGSHGYGIELESVSQPPVFSGLDATLPQGARVHLSGPSGSGKSTVLGLLTRFDDPASGQITLGGVPLTSLAEQELNSRITYVPQEPVVFTGTLAENIRLGRPDASDDEVTSAARRAQLSEVLERDPLGLDQLVGTHGQALSGGERQRVAIARVLLKQAPVILLDEATSALDEATERRIADVFGALDATIVVVTHRDPSIWRPNRTIELSGGRSA